MTSRQGNRLVSVVRWQIMLALVPGLQVPLAWSYHLPLWEFGLGVGNVQAPLYRGAKEEKSYILPFPFIVYRGDFLQVDREDGIRGLLLDRERFSLDLSVAAALPVEDSDSGPREGMPALDLLIEAGLELDANLWRSRNQKYEVDLITPWRLVFSVGDSLLDYEGMTLTPYLNFRYNRFEAAALSRYDLSFGPVYADDDYHDYFYSVDDEFVRPGRPAYSAGGGYGGSRITLSASRDSKRYFVAAFVRFDTLDGAVFESSPLVETDDYYAFGFAFAWKLYSSEKRRNHAH